MARIVLNTFGSLGDLHPFLAIAIELQSRGHEPVIATAEVYRTKIEAEGIRFRPVRPDLGTLLGKKDLIERLWDQSRGTEYLFKDVILPSVEDAFNDLDAACVGADLLLTHGAGLGGPIVAEMRKLRWLSVVLQPLNFFSAYDPPVLAPAQWLKHAYRFGSPPFRLARRLAKSRVKRWAKPILNLRKQLGLQTSSDPLFEGQFSPFGTLALFSSHFAQPQPDWPPNSHVTGFVFYDRLGEGLGAHTSASQEKVAHDLAEFLARGSAPVLFTLGSSAVMHAGDFFAQSTAAVQKLGLRAVMLVGGDATVGSKSKDIFTAAYAPYSQLMPTASVIVHQGGIGTTAQTLRAGRPMLVVPWAHDQPDNGERIRKLGLGRVLKRSRYTSRSVSEELQLLLANKRYATNAKNLGTRISEEDGTRAACDRIEAALT